MYKILPSTKERYIFIRFDDWDCEEPDSFIRFLKAYKEKLSGKIIPLSNEMQYKIDTDHLGLIFQWDGCFGMSVIVPDTADFKEADCTLHTLCEFLNSTNNFNKK